MLSSSRVLLLFFFFGTFPIGGSASIFKFVSKHEEFVDDIKTSWWARAIQIEEKLMRTQGQGHEKAAVPPENAIPILVEGLERSDFGISKNTSDYQRSRKALGFRSCANAIRPSLHELFYEGQSTPDNYEAEAIRVLCYASGGMKHFCACDEHGTCYKSSPRDLPVYAELAPFCEPKEGCHVYLELFHGSLRAELNPDLLFTHPFDAGPVGRGSPYLKVAAVSCSGCARIGGALGQDGCRGQFVPNSLEEQDLAGVLLG